MDMSLSKLWSWWWTGRPGVLRSMGLKTSGHDWATELYWRVLQMLAPPLPLSGLQWRWPCEMLSVLGRPLGEGLMGSWVGGVDLCVLELRVTVLGGGIRWSGRGYWAVSSRCVLQAKWLGQGKTSQLEGSACRIFYFWLHREACRTSLTRDQPVSPAVED